MTTPSSADQPRAALDRIVEEITGLRSTDPTDTAASLLAAWHGFGTAEAAGDVLAEDNVDDAVLARNAQPVMAAVAARLREAPSLPYTDQVAETVDGLVSDDVQGTYRAWCGTAVALGLWSSKEVLVTSAPVHCP